MDVFAANSDHRLAAEDDRVFLVPYRWWREAQELEAEDGPKGIPYTATSVSSSYGMKLINNFFSSDLVFNLRRDDDLRWKDAEVGISGRCYALISWYKWSRALQWHSASNLMMKTIKNLSFMEDGMTDVYPVMLRISITRESNILTVKIGRKDNTVENYKRASKIFSADSEPVRIWDFCGQINLILMNKWNRSPQDCQRHTDQEIVLSVQVYALSEPMACRSEVKKDDLALQQSKMTSFSCCGSLVSNGSVRNMESEFHASGNSRGISSLGLTGLENLGNTCFMNSAIQCLAHTPKLVDYFLGDYSREINQDNQLGMNGELALAFGDLLRKLWALDKTPVVPRSFKAMLARFAPQFSGFNQHDSQELLAFLLDGLHEDLNRVKRKPYLKAKDDCGRPDEVVADEYWKNHLARNDSIIVDIFQGQYKSTLVCPVCNKVSVTFDPFMYLSLPLPSTTMRTMTVSVLCTDGSLEPSPYTINVPKSGKCKDLIQTLSIACSLRDDESLLVAEVYAGCIIRYLEEPSDSLSLLRDGDQLAAYWLPKDLEKEPMVVFMHQRMEEYYNLGKMTSRWKAFGFPLIARLPDAPSGSTICKLFLKLLNPFRRSKDIALDDDRDNCKSASLDQIAKMDASSQKSGCKGTADAGEENQYIGDEFQLYLTDEKGQVMQSKVEMNEPVLWTGLQNQLHILVRWKDKALDQYDKSLLNSLPEIYKYGLFAKRPQVSFTLYACLEAFLKEEPLGPEDMWYCPCCKKHQQASKKLDLWRLPEVLVIHLKRFSYNWFMKNKLETFVEFPIHDLDLSAYVAHRTGHPSHHYRLYAVNNHYGDMEGGHYTAYIYHEGQNGWYDFDDRHVVPISEDSVKMSAAYVLFYRRT